MGSMVKNLPVISSFIYISTAQENKYVNRGCIVATMIPEYKWTDFLKVQKMGKLTELASGEVMFNCEYLFTFLNGNLETSGHIRTKAEYMALSSNTLGGKTIEEILDAVPV